MNYTYSEEIQLYNKKYSYIYEYNKGVRVHVIVRIVPKHD